MKTDDIDIIEIAEPLIDMLSDSGQSALAEVVYAAALIYHLEQKKGQLPKEDNLMVSRAKTMLQILARSGSLHTHAMSLMAEREEQHEYEAELFVEQLKKNS